MAVLAFVEFPTEIFLRIIQADNSEVISSFSECLFSYFLSFLLQVYRSVFFYFSYFLSFVSLYIVTRSLFF